MGGHDECTRMNECMCEDGSNVYTRLCLTYSGFPKSPAQYMKVYESTRLFYTTYIQSRLPIVLHNLHTKPTAHESTRLFYTTYIQSRLLDVEIVVCILTRRVRIAASPVVGQKLGVRVLPRVLCRAHEKHVLEEMGETCEMTHMGKGAGDLGKHKAVHKKT